MLAAGTLMVIFCDVKASDVAKNSVFRAGTVAIVAVYGVAWMADTMFAAHLNDLKVGLTEYVKVYPWAYAIVLLLVSKLVNSHKLLPLQRLFRLPWLLVRLRESWSLSLPPATVTTSFRRIRLTWLLFNSTAPARPISVSS